jgi:hypothetical protein
MTVAKLSSNGPMSVANDTIEEKKFVWIEGTTRRFDGYNYFGEHPEVAIGWFNLHSA